MAKSQEAANRWLIDATNAMVSQAKAETDEWISLWQDGLNYAFNNQLAGKKRKAGWPAVQANYIYPAIVQEMALHAQRRPTIIARPHEPNDSDAAHIWNGLLQFQYDEVLQMQMLNIAASLDAKVYGIYVAKTYWEPKSFWDPQRRRWMGEPRAELVRPEFFGADPEASRIDRAGYIYCKRRIRTDWALGRWPEYKDQILQAASETEESPYQTWDVPGYDSGNDKDKGPDELQAGRLVQLITRYRNAEHKTIPTSSDAQGYPSHLTLTEVYFKDDSEKKAEEEVEIPADILQDKGEIYLENEQWHVGNPERWGGTYKEGDVLGDADWPVDKIDRGKEPVFPYGRYALKLGSGSGEVILNAKEEQQIWPYRSWPYVVGVNQSLPHTWRGLNAVEMPKGLQDWMNVSYSHLLNYVKFFGDPLIMKEEGAVEEGKPLKVSAGAIWNLLRGGLNKIRRDPPPPMGTSVPTAIQFIGKQLQDDTGIHEPSRGQSSPGKQTATEIATLQTSVQTRIGLQLIYKDMWSKKVMSNVADLDKAHMSPGEIVRIVGKDQARAVMAMSQESLELKFDVALKIGTALPFDQERRKQDAERLFANLGMAYLPELLEAFEVENKEEVLARSQEYQQFLAFQAQLEEQQKQAAQSQ